MVWCGVMRGVMGAGCWVLLGAGCCWVLGEGPALVEAWCDFSPGGLMIQSRLTSGEDKSFQAHASLPLLTWIRLDCSVHQAEVRTLWGTHSGVHTLKYTL